MIPRDKAPTIAGLALTMSLGAFPALPAQTAWKAVDALRPELAAVADSSVRVAAIVQVGLLADVPYDVGRLVDPYRDAIAPQAAAIETASKTFAASHSLKGAVELLTKFHILTQDLQQLISALGDERLSQTDGNANLILEWTRDLRANRKSAWAVEGELRTKVDLMLVDADRRLARCAAPK